MSSLLSGIFATGSSAVLPFLVGIAGPVFGYFAARFTAIAPLQTSLNDAFRSLVDELQTERANFIVRISELEGEILRQRGVINNLLAKEDAYIRILRRNNIKPLDGGTYALDT